MSGELGAVVFEASARSAGPVIRYVMASCGGLWQERCAQMAIEDDANATELPSSTELALDRTHLAHDRTLMAWVRTATSLISFGFTIYKFFQYLREEGRARPVQGPFGPREFAFTMICIGLISLLLATLQHWQFRKKLRIRYHVTGFPLTLVMAALISLLGILALIAVIFRH